MSFSEDGFAVLGAAIDRPTREAMRDALDAWLIERGERGPFGILRNNIRCEVDCVAEFVNSGQLAMAACELLGLPDVVLFQDNLVWKPRGAARIEWHQDYSYWPLDAPIGVTFWLALDDSDEANGCMHYIPGTHLLGERQPADFIRGSGQPSRAGLPPLQWAERRADVVSVPVKAGHLLAHHPLVWHMSPANETARQRRALTFSWIGSQVRWDPDHAPHPFNFLLGPTAGTAVRGELFPRFEKGA